jgi:acylglycerol lipase
LHIFGDQSRIATSGYKKNHMKHFETNWKSLDGLNMYAQIWEPGTTQPQAVVCLVHGIGEHTSRYEHVAEAFCRKGFVLFGADHRGHGRSGGPRGHFPTIEAVLQDIELLLQQAKTRYPGLPAFLYGHSLGGILVLHYGLKHKPDVRGIISTSPALRSSIEQQPLKVLAARLLGSLVPGFALHSGLDIKMLSRDEKVVQAYISDPLIHFKITMGTGKIMLNLTRWTLENASEFPLPLLLLHGNADKIAFPEGSIEFAAPLKDKCTVKIWEHSYHELHNDPEKDEVLKTMTEWMEKRLDG